MLSRGALVLHSIAEKTRRAVGSHRQSFFPPMIVGVCGVGGGKTAFCRMLMEALGFERVVWLNEHDYYKDFGVLSFEERLLVDLNDPSNVEFDLLSSHLDHLSAGCSISVPQYDLSARRRVSVSELVLPRPFVIIQGSLLFSSSDIFRKLDRKIFIDDSEQNRFSQLLSHEHWGRVPEDKQASNAIPALSWGFQEDSKAKADLVISDDLSFSSVLADVCSSLEIHDRRIGAPNWRRI